MAKFMDFSLQQPKLKFLTDSQGLSFPATKNPREKVVYYVGTYDDRNYKKIGYFINTHFDT